MALGYRLTITDSKGGEIVLSSMENECQGKGDIIAASYKSNTLNDDAIARSNDVRAEIRVIGRITKENKKATCDVANWSKETDSDLIYRKVKLEAYVSTSSSEMLRSYEIENMFVIDYTEGYEIPTENFPSENLNGENDNGLFELYLVQKNGNYDQYIEVE